MTELFINFCYVITCEVLAGCIIGEIIFQHYRRNET